MENEKLNKQSSCSPLTSIDLLDSRVEQEREAETLEARASRIIDKYFEKELSDILAPAFLAKIIMIELREAVKVERECCARIAYDYPRESFNPVTDKLSPTWHIGELISRRK